jgi:hypothetical protein
MNSMSLQFVQIRFNVQLKAGDGAKPVVKMVAIAATKSVSNRDTRAMVPSQGFYSWLK